MIKLERKIYSSRPFRFLETRSRKVSLPGLQGISLNEIITFFIGQVKKVGLIDRARAIAFSFLIAIPAAAIFICTLIPYLPVHKRILQQLLLLTKDITPNQNTYVLVSQFLEDFLSKPRVGLLSFGFLLALFYSSNAMMGIMRSFNKSLVYNAHRNPLAARWMAIKLTTLVLCLVIGSVIHPGHTSRFAANLAARTPYQQPQCTLALPDRPLGRRSSPCSMSPLPASINMARPSKSAGHSSPPAPSSPPYLTILTTLAFSYWVNRFGNYNKVYGSIGTVMILMLLVYFNSLVLLIGYELNVSIYHLKVRAGERKS